jgi:multisubunit Na+/H+ antiporter MnhB subunit
VNKDNNKGMSIIVKTISRLTVGLIIIYGIYIFSHGHISPGGGFAGGVIIALAFIHLMLAYGKEVALKKLPKGVTSFFEGMGAILFLGIALLGFTGGYFFLNFISKGEPFRLFSAGIIPLANLAIAVKVGSGVFAIFVALVLLKFESERRKK